MVRIKVRIDGMMCGMCESHINDTIRRNFNVRKVSSSHSKGIAEIISENDIPPAELRKVIDETGYKFIGSETSPYEKKRLFGH